MNANPPVTDTDRARGWAELEIELLDGTRQFVRVHALSQGDLLSLAKLTPADALTESLVKALRVDREFVAQMEQTSIFAASALMALLLHGDVAGAAIVNDAAQTVFLRQQQALPKFALAFPQISPELRALLNTLREQGERFRALLPMRHPSA